MEQISILLVLPEFQATWNENGIQEGKNMRTSQYLVRGQVRKNFVVRKS